jgi:bifunctional DNA-binding transcriptional regulator/antitoxin component of YhaV-PrlF toxin-antitoxin module
MYYRAKIVNGGRLLIPDKLRRELNLTDGKSVLIENRNSELRIKPVPKAIQEAREILGSRLHNLTSLSNELISERREDSRKEQG